MQEGGWQERSPANFPVSEAESMEASLRALSAETKAGNQISSILGSRMIRSTRLKCSTHLVFLVLDVQVVAKAGGPVRIEFWRCPLNCGYVRANKHQKKPVRSRESRASIKARGAVKTQAAASMRRRTSAALEQNEQQQASFGF
jgi:hypothetical protein